MRSSSSPKSVHSSPTHSHTATSRPTSPALRRPSRPGSATSSPATATAIRSGGRSAERGRTWSRDRLRLNASSDLDSVADLELGQLSEVEQLGHVVLAAERCKHAGEVPEGSEGGLESFADVLIGRGAAQILVAVRADRFRNDLQLTPV